MYENASKNDLAQLFLSLWNVFNKNGKKTSFTESLVFGKLIDYIVNGFNDPSNTLRSL